MPSSHIRSIAQEFADLRLVLSKIRTELALRQNRPTPRRNAKGYVVFDEVDRTLVLELQAYASYFRGLNELAYRGSVTTVPAALTEADAKLLGNVTTTYCRVQSAHSFVQRATAVTKWMSAKEFLRCHYEAMYAME